MHSLTQKLSLVLSTHTNTVGGKRVLGVHLPTIYYYEREREDCHGCVGADGPTAINRKIIHGRIEAHIIIVSFSGPLPFDHPGVASEATVGRQSQQRLE